MKMIRNLGGRITKINMRRILFILLAVTLITPSSWSAGPAASLVTIINYLLGEVPLPVPMTINGRMVYDGEKPTVGESTVNTLVVDLNDVPLQWQLEIEGVTLDLQGDCYALGGTTLDPLVYQWDVIVDGAGECGLRVTVDSQIEGMSQSLVSLSGLNVSGGMPSDFDELIAMADNGEVNGGFQFSNIVKQSTAPTGADDNIPTMYSFDATKDGVALKGIMMSSERKFDTRNFPSNMNVNAKTFVRSVQGTKVLMGAAVVSSANQNNPADDQVFSFLAVGPSATLPGPAGQPKFHINGKNKLQVICTQNKIAGFGRFDVPRTGTRIAATVVGFTKPSGCGASGFQGESAIYSEFQYVDTPIGKVLRGRGTGHPLNGGKITTVADQNSGNPDYALYFLAIPEQLSNLHKVEDFDSGTVMASTVKVLDPFALAKLAKVRRKNGRMLFSSAPEALSGLAVNDIIIGRPTARLADGFIRRVTNFGPSDPMFGMFFIETEPAGINEVFTDGGFTLNRPLSLGDIEDVVTPEYAFGTAGELVYRQPSLLYEDDIPLIASLFVSAASALNFDVLPFPSRSLDVVFFDADLNHSTKNDQLRTEGFFDLDATIDLQFRCEGALVCNRPFFKLEFEFVEDFELKGIAKLPNDRFGPLEHTVYSKKFANIMIGPIPVRPIVNLNVSMEGFNTVPITFGIDQNFTSSVGIELSQGNWTPLKSRSSTLVAAPEPNYEAGEDKVNLTARAAVEGVLKIAGIAGGSIDVGLYTEVSAESPPQAPNNRIWKLEAGLNSYAQVELDLILASIESPKMELFDIEFPVVARAPLEAPRIDRITVDGIRVENGTVTTNSFIGGFGASGSDPLIFKVTPFDAEDGIGCCNVRLSSSIDGILAEKSGLGDLTASDLYRFPIESLSAGSHVITASIWPVGDHPSTATTETFTMQGANQLSNACDDLDLEAYVNGVLQPSLSILIDEGETVAYVARISGPSGCLPSGETVAFTYCPYSSIVGCFSQTDTITFPSTAAVGSRTYGPGAWTVATQFTNGEGDIIYGPTATIAVPEPSEPAYTLNNDTFEAFTNNSGSQFASNSNDSFMPNIMDKILGPVFAADNATDYELNMFNWTTEDIARFTLPFQRRVGYSYSWESTDVAANIVQNGMGHAQIKPSAGGAGWQQISAIETNNATNRRIVVSKTFYIHQPNSLDFGYVQEDFDTDATHIMPAQ